MVIISMTAASVQPAHANWASDRASQVIEPVVDVIVEVWDSTTDLTVVAATWVKEHPWDTVGIVFMVAGAWDLVVVAKEGYAATRSGPVVGRIFIKKAPKDVCFVSKRACGTWVPTTARDPKRLVSNLSKAEREQVYKAAKCGEKTCISAISGRRIPRSTVQVDHIIPWSCGGATVPSNLRVVSAAENGALPYCANVVSGGSTFRLPVT